MKYTLTFLLLLISVSIAKSDDRIERDQHAREKFWDLNFFSEGRGMTISPGLVRVLEKFYGLNEDKDIADEKYGFRKKIAERRWGIAFERDSIAGFSNEKYGDVEVGVMGCVVCHGGKVAGQYYIGAGNKSIDVWRLAKDVNRVEKIWKKLKPQREKSVEYKVSEDSAISFSSYLSQKRFKNLSQGLVPVAYIRGWFYKVHGEEVPELNSLGQVKVPALWGYGEKLKAGQFCDGFGDASELGWAVAVELAAGQKHEVVRKYYQDVVAAEELLADFLPPKYPFFIDRELAKSGEKVFNNTCAGCHGTYEKDSNGHPIFKIPKFIPWSVVRTDRDRLLGNTEAFIAQVRKSPLNDLIKVNNYGPGYFAPRLEGVWARFPYLHNASVPSVWDLLKSPENRPSVFGLRDIGERERFSEIRLGLVEHSRRETDHLKSLATRGARHVYDTTRLGHSNQGHNFYTNLQDDIKLSLIEYLKTL